ncbi:MAG TPA: helix-turn-helix domain-containing protein [Chloroflexota bacterium]
MHNSETFTFDAHALGLRIASLLRACGWSQRRLAEAAGVSHGYVALLELGRLPSPGKLRLDAIARALSLPSSDALTSPTPTEVDALAISGALPAQAVEHASGSPLSVDQGGAGVENRDGKPSSAGASAGDTRGEVANVVGSLEQLRGIGARPLPIFRWGACGDPRDQESAPDPDRLEYPPPGRETLIGPHGFGVVVKGDSMAGRGIVDGDVVWVNPERPYGVGKVVLALVSDVGGEPAGMVVNTYARTEVGDCLLSETAAGRTPVVCREFKVIGPVVGITSWRLPS